MRISDTGTRFKMADEEEDEEVCDSWEDMADSGVRSSILKHPNSLKSIMVYHKNSFF
jgi:hypothetical protein